jgi:hypothetical protein
MRVLAQLGALLKSGPRQIAKLQLHPTSGGNFHSQPNNIDPHQRPCLTDIARCSQTKGRSAMPANAMILSAVIVVMFVMFGAVLMWADFQTRPHRLKNDGAKPRRRAF